MGLVSLPEVLLAIVKGAISVKTCLTRKLTRGAAVAAVLVGAVALPASPAQAQPGGLPCPRIHSLCGEGVEGSAAFFLEAEPFVEPPLQRAVNNDFRPWCVYTEPGFQGWGEQLNPGEYHQFNHPVFAVEPGPCSST